MKRNVVLAIPFICMALSCQFFIAPANDSPNLNGIWMADVIGKTYIQFENGNFTRVNVYASNECTEEKGTYTTSTDRLTLAINGKDSISLVYSLISDRLTLENAQGIAIKVAYAKASQMPTQYLTIFRNRTDDTIRVTSVSPQTWNTFDIAPGQDSILRLAIPDSPLYAQTMNPLIDSAIQREVTFNKRIGNIIQLTYSEALGIYTFSWTNPSRSDLASVVFQMNDKEYRIIDGASSISFSDLPRVQTSYYSYYTVDTNNNESTSASGSIYRPNYTASEYAAYIGLKRYEDDQILVIYNAGYVTVTNKSNTYLYNVGVDIGTSLSINSWETIGGDIPNLAPGMSGSYNFGRGDQYGLDSIKTWNIQQYIYYTNYAFSWTNPYYH